MGLLDRFRRSGEPSSPHPGGRGSDRRYLEEWASTRHGVEAFVEPRTNLNRASILLVAHDGEWTRRAVPNEKAAYEWAHSVAIPCYNASLVGYPRRMQQWRPVSDEERP